MANDLVKRLAAFANCEANELEDTLNEAAVRIEELERELKLLLKLKGAIDECRGDTWECPRCGHSEPWWTDSNAHYASEYPDAPK